MHDKRQKNDVSPVAAALTGIVIGAAGAAAVALSDEDTRKKATKKAQQMKQDLKKWGDAKFADMQKKSQTVKKTADEKVSEKKKEIAENVKARITEEEKN